MTKDARMNVLKNAGIDIDNMFSLKFEDGLKPGARIDVFVTNGDEVETKIKDDGYVNNSHLYRRWVCAQMLRIVFRINEDPWRYGKNFAEYMKMHYSWEYQLKMMEDELKVLMKMEREHDPQFEIRSKFFSIENVKKIYTEFLKEYERIKRNTYFTSYLTREAVACPVDFVDLYSYLHDCYHYDDLFAAVKYINKRLHVLKEIGHSLDFSKTWLDCYKGAGAYYTLQNLVLFHNVGITTYFGEYKLMITGEDAYKYLNEKVEEYRNEGWKMYGFMKQVLEDNRFDITKLY